MADGEVVYDVRANDSNLEGDLNQAEKKTNSFLNKSSSAAQKAGKVAGVAFAAIGSAAVMAGTKAITGAVDLDKAMNQFAVTTGIGEEALGKYEDTLKSIYTNNYGESFEDIADAMATVNQQMGDLDQDSLQSITESAFALRDTLGYEVNESIRAASTMMKQFGISGDQAMNLIATGAQNGLDFSGELLDSINEYSVQFAKVGLDADDMFKIMEKGAETGAWNLDKVGDAIKEMSIRVVDGSDTTAEGFTAIGLDAGKMSAAFAKGGDSAKKAFNQTVKALAGIKDPLQQNIAGVNLFGTMWEDLGPEVVTQLASIEDGAYATGKELEKMKDVKYDDLGSMLEGLGRTLEMLLIPLGESLIPLIQQIVETLMPKLEEYLGPIMETLGGVVEQILPLVETLLPPLLEIISMLLPYLTDIIEKVLPVMMEVLEELLPPLLDIVEAILPPLFAILDAILDPLLELIQVILPPLSQLLEAIAPLFEALTPIITFLADLFKNSLGTAIDIIMPIFENLMDTLSGLITFITGVFSGDWDKAWDGIVQIFKSCINVLPSILESVVNGAIGIVNGIIKGINKLTGLIGIPEIPLIPKVEIPRFHAGGIVDFEAGGEGVALLKDGEMVLTQAQQKQLFEMANGSIPGQQTVVVQSPVYLDGRLISKSTTDHQFADVMARRYR